MGNELSIVFGPVSRKEADGLQSLEEAKSTFQTFQNYLSFQSNLKPNLPNVQKNEKHFTDLLPYSQIFKSQNSKISIDMPLKRKQSESRLDTRTMAIMLKERQTNMTSVAVSKQRTSNVNVKLLKLNNSVTFNKPRTPPRSANNGQRCSLWGLSYNIQKKKTMDSQSRIERQLNLTNVGVAATSTTIKTVSSTSGVKNTTTSSGNPSTKQKLSGDKEMKNNEKDEFDQIPMSNIRNFSIIAHIDHGKSTFADRLLEMTGVLTKSEDNKQVLDKLQVEKERGITVKAQTASLLYKYNGEDYLLNLIDTPGHVDFTNEVARSIAACQGVILLVDANQGVQAQTVANYYMAFNKGLKVMPVLNKIDLANANPEEAKEQLFNIFNIDPDDVLMMSAKTGLGVDKVLEALIQRVPAPPGDRSAPLRALVFDSWYDKYRGAVALVYVRDGNLTLGDEITSSYSKQSFSVKGVGMLRPSEQPTQKLLGGQVGFLICNMRSTTDAHIGDTFHTRGSQVEPLEQFKPASPMVFAGVYPLDKGEFPSLKSAIEKLALNDPSVSLSSDHSPVLGQGWRVGFLGLLHLEVFNQRLEQEYDAEAIMTAPSVTYKVKLKGKKAIGQYGGEEILLSDPTKLPSHDCIEQIEEPMVLGTIITPDEYISKVMSECIERRGVQIDTSKIDNLRQMLKFELPLNEIIIDFHDTLKGLSSGYASFDYEDIGFRPSDLVKLDILVNHEVVDAMSSLVHSTKATEIGKRMVNKLKDIIPRQQIPVALQAAVGKDILARENIKAFRKDVTAKLYGGDVTRKNKLLEKQKKGKAKMKQFAKINIPKEAFINYLKR